MKASLCPVCNGKGVVYGIAETGAFPTQQCHGCGGKGWVEVEENKSIYYTCLECNHSYTNETGRCPLCQNKENVIYA